MSQEEKDQSHRRIIASAAKLFRRDGEGGASVAEVMNDAGMTHGGFYKHFDSKESMLCAAIDLAFDDIIERLGPDLSEHEGAERTADFKRFYLSDDHVRSPALGCPLPSVSSDVARGGPDLQSRFSEGVQRVIELLARDQPGPARQRRARATSQLAMLAGAVMMARASDPKTASEILSACRAALRQETL